MKKKVSGGSKLFNYAVYNSVRNEIQTFNKFDDESELKCFIEESGLSTSAARGNQNELFSLTASCQTSVFCLWFLDEFYYSASDVLYDNYALFNIAVDTQNVTLFSLLYFRFMMPLEQLMPVLERAALKNAPNIIQWVLYNVKERDEPKFPIVQAKLLQCALICNCEHLIQLLSSASKDVCIVDATKCFMHAIQNSYLMSLHWMAFMFDFDENTLLLALKSAFSIGDLMVCKFLVKKYGHNTKNNNVYLHCIAESGCVELLVWFTNEFNITYDDLHLIRWSMLTKAVLKEVHFEMLQHLWCIFFESTCDDTKAVLLLMDLACKNGNVKLVQWCKGRHVMWSSVYDVTVESLVCLLNTCQSHYSAECFRMIADLLPDYVDYTFHLPTPSSTVDDLFVTRQWDECKKVCHIDWIGWKKKSTMSALFLKVLALQDSDALDLFIEIMPPYICMNKEIDEVMLLHSSTSCMEKLVKKYDFSLPTLTCHMMSSLIRHDNVGMICWLYLHNHIPVFPENSTSIFITIALANNSGRMLRVLHTLFPCAIEISPENREYTLDVLDFLYTCCNVPSSCWVDMLVYAIVLDYRSMYHWILEVCLKPSAEFVCKNYFSLLYDISPSTLKWFAQHYNISVIQLEQCVKVCKPNVKSSIKESIKCLKLGKPIFFNGSKVQIKA